MRVKLNRKRLGEYNRSVKKIVEVKKYRQEVEGEKVVIVEPNTCTYECFFFFSLVIFFFFV